MCIYKYIYMYIYISIYICDFPIKTSIHGEFSIAMLDYQGYMHLPITISKDAPLNTWTIALVQKPPISHDPTQESAHPQNDFKCALFKVIMSMESKAQKPTLFCA